MECSGCKEQKLSNEFPHGRVTESCHHCPWCSRCVIQSYEKDKTCPGCSGEIEKEEYDVVCARLALVAHEDQFKVLSTPAPLSSTVPSNFNVFATTLTGEQKELEVRATSTLDALRYLIKTAFGIEPEYQRLFFKGKELNPAMKLTQQGVRPASRIQVQQVMLAIYSHSKLRNIEFSLQWVYRTVHPAYMNGSCLIYCGDQYWGAVDFRSPTGFAGITHHGWAKVDFNNKMGTQKISISLNHLHPGILSIGDKKETRDTKDSRNSRDSRDLRDSRDSRGRRDSREPNFDKPRDHIIVLRAECMQGEVTVQLRAPYGTSL